MISGKDKFMQTFWHGVKCEDNKSLCPMVIYCSSLKYEGSGILFYPYCFSVNVKKWSKYQLHFDAKILQWSMLHILYSSPERALKIINWSSYRRQFIFMHIPLNRYFRCKFQLFPKGMFIIAIKKNNNINKKMRRDNTLVTTSKLKRLPVSRPIWLF